MYILEKTKIRDFSQGDRIFIGRYKTFQCELHYTRNRYWYFICESEKKNIQYNSLLDKKKYYSQEKCYKACIKYIDNIIKGE